MEQGHLFFWYFGAIRVCECFQAGFEIVYESFRTRCVYVGLKI